MKMRVFYAVIEQPGNVAACHVNEEIEFANLSAMQRWIDQTETELFPDGSTQIAVAVSPVDDQTVLTYGYVGEPKGEV